jgi:hypothetical protein
MALALCEMMWLKDLLKELRVLKNETMLLHWDNVAAINIANNPVQFDHMKHVDQACGDRQVLYQGED